LGRETEDVRRLRVPDRVLLLLEEVVVKYDQMPVRSTLLDIACCEGGSRVVGSRTRLGVSRMMMRRWVAALEICVRDEGALLRTTKGAKTLDNVEICTRVQLPFE